MQSEEERQIKTKMDSLANEYMKKNIPDATVDSFENLAIAFTYIQSVNLIRSSDRLKWWTIAMVVLMICTIIANVIFC